MEVFILKSNGRDMDVKSYDVVVCGAGIAGVAAAVTVARQGMNTALIEKQCLLGGLATSGLIYIYLPLCDGYGTQVISGIAEEMIRSSVEYGPFDIPLLWGGPQNGNPGISGKRFQCCFSPAGFTLTLDKMLEETGVDLWLDTMVIDAQTEERNLRSVTVANSSGQIRIDGKCFIDATGGAFVVQMAGGKVHRNENFVTPWFLEMSEEPDWFHFEGPLHVKCEGAISEQFKYPDCKTGKQVTGFVRKTWDMIRRRYDLLSPQKRKRNYPVHLPAMPQLRKIAHIDAVRIINGDDHQRKFEDSVGLVSDWRCPATPWDIPYRALIPGDLNGILAAGRCIGAAGEAWEVCRVIPVAAKTGEVAGFAASEAVKMEVPPTQIDYNKLKTLLKLEVNA